MDELCPYAVVIDRISHEVPYYRSYLKNAVLQGTTVVNNILQNNVAGLFLSLSVVLAGLFLVRSRRKLASRAVAAALVCVFTVAAAAVAAYANAAPPVGWRAQDPGTLLKTVSDGRAREGHVRVEVVEEGYDIRLLVPAKEWKGDEEE